MSSSNDDTLSNLPSRQNGASQTTSANVNVYTTASVKDYKYVVVPTHSVQSNTLKSAYELNEKLASEHNYNTISELKQVKNISVDTAELHHRSNYYVHTSRNHLVQSDESIQVSSSGNSGNVNQYNTLASGRLKKTKTTRNSVHVHANLGCGQSCMGFANFCCAFFTCFGSFCCRPCCSAAGLLAGIGALGGLLAGAIMMGVMGFIPIPIEVTKAICNMTHDRNFYYHNDNLSNLTGINVFDPNFTTRKLRF